MEQLVQCPVCTLYLHNGMSLENHLDTHPKDQVIKALCNLSTNTTTYSSRTSTPTQSERSYRSRSRTPATEDSQRWSSSHRSSDNERYWRRTPKSTPASNPSRSCNTPSDRLSDINFENNSTSTPCQFPGVPYPIKTDRIQQTYVSPPVADYEQPAMYYPEQQEDREVKYSRSAEYKSIDASNNIFAYNMPSIAPGVKVQTTLLPAMSRRSNDGVKLMPKTSNILVKTNIGGVQYLTPGVKPMHMMVPTAPTFVQKNVQNNMIMTSGLQTPQLLDPKSVVTPMTNQFSQISSGPFTPGTTVVTQNSQIIYREMVHNLDGKPFITSMPAVLGNHDNDPSLSHTSSMYQNVMVVDQFGNTSCMYTAPQMMPKPCNPPPVYTESIPNPQLDKTVVNDGNKTLIIEVGPIIAQSMDTTSQSSAYSHSSPASFTSHSSSVTTKSSKSSLCTIEKIETKIETPGSTKGLKILSNIKVEVPVQHHKNLLNTVVDLTGANEAEYKDLKKQERPLSPDEILPDLNSQTTSDDSTQPSTSSTDSLVSNAFSVIKNVGNPPSYKDSSTKMSLIGSKSETEYSDSPVPDLICNEKPSISPCSELSESGENSTDRTSISPKLEKVDIPQISPAKRKKSSSIERKYPSPPKPNRNNLLRLNNIFVKKHKKVLQIKNFKPASGIGIPDAITPKTEIEPIPSSSSCRSPDNFSINSNYYNENLELKDKSGTLQTMSVELLNESHDNEFDADTEEQSMDIEPSRTPDPQIPYNSGVSIQIKEEINSSNEGGFGDDGLMSARELTPLESIRPINVISYGNMTAGDFEDESNHRELLELEAASKSKQFVNMMNDNYFGDNIYADYFTPDRVEAFDADRQGATKDGMYIWGEPSQKVENEFVLPNFIEEGYKMAEGGAGPRGSAMSDSEPALNICADERMPPRGELSGQESNGDMDSAWTRMYAEGAPTEPYDLIARESWISDGSEADVNEKRDNLQEEPVTKGRVHTCGQCGAKLSSLRELRSHRTLVHAPSTSRTYSKLVTQRTIKKEVKTDDTPIAETLIDSKESIATSILQDCDALPDAKPKIEGIVKQEAKRRPRKDHVCPTCKVDQGSDAAFHAHLKIHPLECLTCGKLFFRRANLALHVKTHLGIKNYKCEVCEKRFLTRQKMMEHLNVHTGRTPVKCTLCDDTFKRYSNMVQHRDRHHLQKKAKVRDYLCGCGLVFHSRARLRWHAETHAPRPRACTYCSDKFVHAASLTRHVRRNHNQYYLSHHHKPTDNVPCVVCKQVYLRSNLRAHMQTHSGKRPYHCVICNKSFTTKWNLKLHRWTHMSRSSKPYKCTLCKGAFIRQSEYVSHMNAHKSVRPYTCNYCGCQFIRKYNCQRHVREHEMGKKYVCKVPECGKSFHRSYYLSEHMKVHSGARPFSCNICGKTTSNKSNHNKHLKIHHAREPVATEA